MLSSHRLSLALVVVGAIAFSAPEAAWAQGVPNNAAEALIAPFHALFMDANGVVPRIQVLVRQLFWSLVLVELVISMGMILMRANSVGMEGFAAFIVQRILLVGIFAFFLENGHTIALAIGLRNEPDHGRINFRCWFKRPRADFNYRHGMAKKLRHHA